MTKQQIIIESIQVVTGITLEQMRARTRKRHICDARRLFCGVMRELSPLVTFGTLAETLNLMLSSGKPDHAAVFQYARTDKDVQLSDNMYRTHRQQIVDRVNRKSVTGMSGVQAWGIAWGGMECKALSR